MIIPTPKLERLPYPLHGLNSFQQILYRWHHPPRYRLIERYVITTDEGLELAHPPGFIIDGASIPRWLWPIIEPTGTLFEGSVPHDMYYQYGFLLATKESGGVFNIASMQMYEKWFGPDGSMSDLVPVFIGRGQKFGDQLLRQITIEKHGATVDADRAYLALRAFGWMAWNRYRRRGPTAYNNNSLGIPGITDAGVAF